MKKYALHEIPRDELLGTFVEVSINGSDDFLKIKETLTRMGVANKKDKRLFQSCHILHKTINEQSRYFIVHFKELFALDGREVFMGEDDYARRNSIATMLEAWGLLKVISDNAGEPKLGDSKELHRNMLMVLRSAEKSEWSLEPKYKIGVKK